MFNMMDMSFFPWELCKCMYANHSYHNQLNRMIHDDNEQLLFLSSIDGRVIISMLLSDMNNNYYLISIVNRLMPFGLPAFEVITQSFVFMTTINPLDKHILILFCKKYNLSINCTTKELSITLYTYCLSLFSIIHSHFIPISKVNIPSEVNTISEVNSKVNTLSEVNTMSEVIQLNTQSEKTSIENYDVDENMNKRRKICRRRKINGKLNDLHLIGYGKFNIKLKGFSVLKHLRYRIVLKVNECFKFSMNLSSFIDVSINKLHV